jgi:hypothetical protein
MLIGPWDDHCPKRPTHGVAGRTTSLTGSAEPASRMNAQESAHEGRCKVTVRMGRSGKAEPLQAHLIADRVLPRAV